MQARTAFTALALAAAFAGSAFAETPTPDVPFTGTLARAEVQADLAAYQRAGVNPWSTQYNPLRNFRSTTTRAAVVADYLAARDEVTAFGGEDSGSQYLAQMRAIDVDTRTLAGTPRNAQ